MQPVSHALRQSLLALAMDLDKVASTPRKNKEPDEEVTPTPVRKSQVALVIEKRRKRASGIKEEGSPPSNDDHRPPSKAEAFSAALNDAVSVISDKLAEPEDTHSIKVGEEDTPAPKVDKHVKFLCPSQHNKHKHCFGFKRAQKGTSESGAYSDQHVRSTESLSGASAISSGSDDDVFTTTGLQRALNATVQRPPKTETTRREAKGERYRTYIGDRQVHLEEEVDKARRAYEAVQEKREKNDDDTFPVVAAKLNVEYLEANNRLTKAEGELRVFKAEIEELRSIPNMSRDEAEVWKSQKMLEVSSKDATRLWQEQQACMLFERMLTCDTVRQARDRWQDQGTAAEWVNPNKKQFQVMRRDFQDNEKLLIEVANEKNRMWQLLKREVFKNATLSNSAEKASWDAAATRNEADIQIAEAHTDANEVYARNQHLEYEIFDAREQLELNLDYQQYNEAEANAQYDKIAEGVRNLRVLLAEQQGDDAEAVYNEEYWPLDMEMKLLKLQLVERGGMKRT